jgi:uncharacterized repeat protein (TIGR02543 family)
MKYILRTGFTLLLAVALLCSSILFQKVNAETKISDKEYHLTLNERKQFFIGNEKAVSRKVGSKVFLTYTVQKTTYNGQNLQVGVVGTTTPKAVYPYEGGTMKFAEKMDLFTPGYTYFFCFERTEDGFRYEGYKSDGVNEVKLVFPANYGPADGAYTHYGIWAYEYKGGSISTVLNHMRCYDEDGNDLGIYVSGKTTNLNEINTLLDFHPVVNERQDIIIEGAPYLAISNENAPSNKNAAVYMEYEVEELSEYSIIQMGLICTKAPEQSFPYSGGAGSLQWLEVRDSNSEYSLLTEGAKYFICFKKEADDFIGMVQRTINGVTETVSFSLRAGTYDPQNAFYSIWFAEGGKFSAKLKNFKCYDETGTSLGIQFGYNRADSIEVVRIGEILDYTESIAAYYCKANGQVLALADGQVAYMFDAEGQEPEGVHYKIVNGAILILDYESGKDMYDYTSMVITDADGNQYERMGKKTITFVSGTTTTMVSVSVENGYRSVEPEAPVRENDTFLGWYLGDGTKYEFGTLVTESITLYAKWESESNITYVPAEPADYAWIIAVTTSLLLVAITVVVGIKLKSKKESRK